jgi:hypothetical protein
MNGVHFQVYKNGTVFSAKGGVKITDEGIEGLKKWY